MNDQPLSGGENDFVTKLNAQAEAAIAIKDYDIAIECYEKALEQVPLDIDLHVNIGNVQRLKGDEAASLVWYHKALEIEPDFWRPHHNLGVYYLGKEQFELSQAHLLKSLETAPDPYITLNSLGNLYAERGQTGKAIEYYQQAIVQKPTGFVADYSLGKLYFDLEDWHKSIEILKHALDFAQEEYLYHVYFLLAEAYKKIDDNENAIDFYQKILSLKPGEEYSYFQLAGLYQKLGQDSKAIEYSKKALDVNPKHEAEWKNLLHFCHLKSDWENLVISGKKAIQYFPGNALFLFALSDALGRLKQFDEALYYAKKLVEVSPEDPEHRAILGLLYNSVGNWESALQEFHKTYKLFHEMQPKKKHVPFDNIIEWLELNKEYNLAELFKKSKMELSKQ